MNPLPAILAADRVCAADARVVRKTLLCREHVELEFVLPGFPESKPGQFLQLRCLDDAEIELPAAMLSWTDGGFPALQMLEWGQAIAFLRRPFSIADHWTDDNGLAHLGVISRAIGPGTRWLDQLKPGDTLNITGPLGRGFEIPTPGTPLVLVGGGVGIPPLLYLARRLKALGHRDVTIIFGAMTRDLFPVPLLAEPAADGTPQACLQLPGAADYPALVTTNDGSLGLRGLVTDALRAWQTARSRAKAVSAATVFACGPEGMLRAVARLTRELRLDCQLCIERLMGCGLGTCLSCVTRVRDASRPAGWRWALSCSEGPVFERDRLFDYADGVAQSP